MTNLQGGVVSKRSSPLKVFLAVTATIFLAEGLVMLLLPILLPKASSSVEAMADACLLSVLSAPVVWWLVVRPLSAAAVTEEAKFRSLLEATPDAVVGIDAEGRIALVNTQAENLFGYSRQELLGQALERLLPEQIRETHVRQRTGYFSSPRPRPMGASLDLQGRRKDGSLFSADISLGVLPANDGPLALSVIRDVTQRKQTEDALTQANQKLTAGVKELERNAEEMLLLQEMGGLLQFCVKIEEAYRIISNQAGRLFPGQSGSLSILNSSRNLMEAVTAWGEESLGEQTFMPAECWSLRLGRVHFGGTASCDLPCQQMATAKLSDYACLPMMAHGETVGVLRLRAKDKGMTEVTRRLAVVMAEHIGLALANLRLREKLRNQSIRDALTGVFNRRYLDESLDRELCRAARSKSPLGVIMMDLDHFKRFNDTQGHEAGDAVLRALGGFLRAHVRGSDIVCRYGGEEFAIILLDASLGETSERAEELRTQVKNMDVNYRGGALEIVTLSLGVAAFPKHGRTAGELLRAADAALYNAKTEGRNRVKVAKLKTRRSAEDQEPLQTAVSPGIKE